MIMKDDVLYAKLLARREEWKPLTGGISNEVFLVEENGFPRYVVKQINPSNDQLFILFDQFITILQHLPTTLHVDAEKYVVIEDFLSGGVVKDLKLFSSTWPSRVFALLEDVHSLSMPIAQEKNVILTYIHALDRFLVDRSLNQEKLEGFKVVAFRCLEALQNKHFLASKSLVFSHIDVQKYNIIYDEGKDELHLIDWEYAGYTWRGFDEANFIFLLANSFLERKQQKGGVEDDDQQYRLFRDDITYHHTDDEVSDIAEAEVRFNLDELLTFTAQRYGNDCSVDYLKDLMYVAGYLWLLWSYVKLELTSNEQRDVYERYAEQVKTILRSVHSG